MFRKRVPKNSTRRGNAVFDIHRREGSWWDHPRELVSLRRRLYRRHPVLTSAGALVAILVLVLTADTFMGHANTVYWYPQSCLGGWTGSENAAGAPELSSLASSSEFTSANSAILNNSISQIFCGEFIGDIPEGSEPVSAILRVSWAFKTALDNAIETQDFPAVDGDGATGIPDGADPSLGDGSVVDKVPGTEIPAIEAPATNETPAEPPMEPKSDPGPAPEPAPEPAENGAASIIFDFVRRAFAQEAEVNAPAPSEAAVGGGDAAPENDAEKSDVEEPAPAGADGMETPDSGDSPAEVTPAENAPPEGSSTGIPASPADAPPDDRSILTIRYRMGGGPWLILEIVTESNLQNSSFDIPFSSWEDLQGLEVSLTSVPVSDIAPVVYLDGMSLVVDHEPTDPLVIEDEMMLENLETPSLPPPISERVVPDISEIDENAKHSCAIEPFRVDISNVTSTAANIILRGDGDGLSDIGIGHFPRGIDVSFAEKGGYAYLPKSGEVSIGLEISKQDGSQKGDFNIPLIYTFRKGLDRSSVICQLNIVNR